jgi:hypothetical protein
MAVRMKITVFRYMTPYSLVERCQRFGQTCYLSLQGRQLSGSGDDRIQNGRTRSGAEDKSETSLGMYLCRRLWGR